MPLPTHIVVRHEREEIKGRILDVPGPDGGIWIYDPQKGDVLAKGFKLKVLSSKKTQLNEAAAPVEKVTVEVTRVTAGGGRESYNIVVPVQRILEDFPAVIREGVGSDAEFDDKEPFDKLLLVTLAASDKTKEHLAPTYNTPQWTEANGWFYEGKMVCHAPVEIARELKDPETGATLYRLRVPRADGTGFNYTTVSWEELHAGRYIFPSGLVNIRNAPKTAIGMLNRWTSLNEGQRAAQIKEEETQPERDAQARRAEEFRRAAPLYSAPHYRSRGM
jgi:hypothetical protein